MGSRKIEQFSDVQRLFPLAPDQYFFAKASEELDILAKELLMFTRLFTQHTRCLLLGVSCIIYVGLNAAFFIKLMKKALGVRADGPQHGQGSYYGSVVMLAEFFILHGSISYRLFWTVGPLPMVEALASPHLRKMAGLITISILLTAVVGALRPLLRSPVALNQPGYHYYVLE